jgi:hypothetical protein
MSSRLSDAPSRPSCVEVPAKSAQARLARSPGWLGIAIDRFEERLTMARVTSGATAIDDEAVELRCTPAARRPTGGDCRHTRRSA